MNGKVFFLDSSYAIALSSHRDQFHGKAVEVAEKLEAPGVKITTTRAVMLEIGNACSKSHRRGNGAKLLKSIETDPQVRIHSLNEEWYARGFKLFCERTDKDWGLTDCISFEVMEDMGITQALTADEHFRQAGFRPLLLE